MRELGELHGHSLGAAADSFQASPAGTKLVNLGLTK
jgi:hypothetical protein